MAFFIKLREDTTFEEFEELCVKGELVIGDFREEFNAPVEIWSAWDYKKQWLAAIERFTQNTGENKCALVVQMRNPGGSEFILCWNLHREGERIFIRNQMVFCQGNEALIEEGVFDRLIGDRETESEDGEKISEWETSMDDVLEFARTLRG